MNMLKPLFLARASNGLLASKNLHLHHSIAKNFKVINQKVSFSSAFKSSRSLPLRIKLVGGKVSLRYLSVGCNKRARIVDGRTTDGNKDQNEEKLVTRVDVDEEIGRDKNSSKTDITYRPLSMKAIEEIMEKIDKIAAPYLRPHQREKLLQKIKSHLVAFTKSDTAEMRRMLGNRQRSHIAKTAEEKSHTTCSEGSDWRLSSIVLPEFNSPSKSQEKVEAHEIYSDRLVKITTNADENAQKDANLTVDDKDIEKRSE